MTYKLSKEAANDLENIWLYTLVNWSEEQADRYYNLLLDEIEYAAKNPLAGKDHSHIREGYFRIRSKSHYIFYRVNSNEDVIEVVRILHQRMDIEARLND
jgi:toxin ParE1/3/4